MGSRHTFPGLGSKHAAHPSGPSGGAGPLFALEQFEQRLFFSADPTTQKILDAFEFVHNTIEYQPYAGLMKGPVATEQTKAGNAWDQAALLVDKLRNAGVTAKYDWGRVSLPTEDVTQWLGVKTPEAAETALKFANVQLNDATISFDHAWVRAQLDDGTWRFLDPSWKFKDRSEVGLELKYVPFVQDDYLSKVRQELPYEYYEGEVAAALQDGVSLADVPYDGPIIAKQFNEIPDLPTTTYGSASGGTDHVPSNMTHRVRVSLTEQKDAEQTVKFDINRTGRYVRVQLADTNYTDQV